MYTIKKVSNYNVGLLIALMMMVFYFSVSVDARIKYKHMSATHYNKLIYYGQFKRLSTENKKRYIANVRKIVLDYEKTFSNKKYSGIFNFILPTASANKYSNINDYCHIGGISLQTVGDRQSCPTRGRNCDRAGSDDNYKCGIIYNQVCVKRTPVTEISKRCFKEAGDVLPENEALYRANEKVIRDIAVGQCGERYRSGVDTSDSNAPCDLMLARLYQIKTTYGDLADTDTDNMGTTVEEPPQNPVTDDGPAQASSDQPTDKPPQPRGRPLIPKDKPRKPVATKPVQVVPNNCPTELGDCYNPLTIQPGSTSFNNIGINSNYCSDKRDISFRDSRGVKTSFYLGPDGQLCREVSAPNARIKRKLDKHNKLLSGNIDSKSCSKDIISCTNDMFKNSNVGFERKILDKINKMDRTLFVSAGLCGRNCPTDIAKSSCKGILKDWNNFVSSPGGVLLRRGKNIKNILRRTNNSKGELLSRSSLSNQSSKVKKKIYKLCLKAFPKRKEICVKDNHLMLVNNVRKAYDENYKLKKGQVINVKSLKSLVDQTNAANETFRETTKAKPQKKMNKCLDAIADLTIKLEDLKNVRNIKPKILCGKKLAEAPGLDKDIAYRTDAIYGSGGKVVGKIVIDNNKVKINSSPSSKGSIELDFNKDKVTINQFTTSNGASSLDGKFLIDYNSCNDFKKEGFLCNEPQKNVVGIDLSNYKLERAKVAGKNCIVAVALNSSSSPSSPEPIDSGGSN